MGIVNVPVVTTLAIEDPEIIPVNPEAIIDALAGPPLNFPTRAMAKSKKYFHLLQNLTLTQKEQIKKQNSQKQILGFQK